MSKQSMINEIKNNLSLKNVHMKIGGNTDFSFDQELSAKGFGGKGSQITLQISAFLNEQQNIIYYYEKIIKSQKGFTFSNNLDNTFHDTKCNVTQEILQPDGTKITVNFNTGDISSVFNDVAKRYGWKFKKVIKIDNAVYPIGYVGSDMASSNIPPVQQPQQQYQQPYQQQAPKANNKSVGNLWYITFGILAFSYIFLFLFGGANIIGIILGVLLLGVTFFLRKFMISKGILGTVSISIVIFFALILLLVFTVDSNDSQNNLPEQETPINANDTQQNEVQQSQETVFYAQNINRSLWFSQTTPIPFEKTSISLFGEISISIQDATWPNNIEQNAIKQISVKNIDIISAPKYGFANIINVDGSYPNTQEQRDQAVAPNEYDLIIYDVYEEGTSNRNYYINEHQNGSVNIFYAVYDVVELAMNNVNPAQQLKEKIQKTGLTQKDIKGIVSFDIEIQTKDGRIFNKHFEEQMLNGDLKMEMYVGPTTESENYKDNPNQTAWK